MIDFLRSAGSVTVAKLPNPKIQLTKSVVLSRRNDAITLSPSSFSITCVLCHFCSLTMRAAQSRNSQRIVVALVSPEKIPQTPVKVVF